MNLRKSALLGWLLMVPFLGLELIFNSRNWTPGPWNIRGPVLLFGLLWLLPMSLSLIASPLLTAARRGKKLTTRPVLLAVRVVSVVLLAWMWGALLIDQLPCFIGVPNCD